MNLQFNFDKKRGKIKPMHAVGQPPFCLDLNKIYSGMFHYLKEANIPYSRMHDVGGPFGQNLFVDIPNIFRCLLMALHAYLYLIFTKMMT